MLWLRSCYTGKKYAPELGLVILYCKTTARCIDRLNRTFRNLPGESLRKEVLALPIIRHDNNDAFPLLLTEGVDVKFSIGDGKSRTGKVWLADFTVPENNEFLAVNQFTVVENSNNRRPDIVLFINGLPLVIFELKNAVDEKADVLTAFHQLKTYSR
jgi:type I restriction enzyme R subunit